MNHWALLVLRLGLGGLFVYASTDKISYPTVFADSVATFQILPPWLIPSVAVILPWLELVAGLALTVGFLGSSSALILSALSGAFAGGVLFAYMKGTDITCGCLQLGEGGASVWHIVLNLVLVAIGLVLVRLGPGSLSVDYSIFGAPRT